MVAANRGDESMDTSQRAAAEKSSLAQEWLGALRYWLGGRRGLIGLAVVLGLAAIALNWGWLVAVGIAPLLLAFAPCAAMCALGLCASRMGGGSCSTETNPVAAPKPDARVAPSLEAGEPGPIPLLADKSTGLDEPTAGSAISVAESPKPEERS
jgi:hypothetical protein